MDAIWQEAVHMEQNEHLDTQLLENFPKEPILVDNNTNVLRRHIKDDPMKEKLEKHRLWMNSMPHEYPMP